MSEQINYKCPNCSGAIIFDSGAQKMACPYCSTQFDVETLKAYDDAIKNDVTDSMDWKKYDSDSGNGDWNADETANLNIYSCDSCGGEIVGDDTLAATSCPYCGNSVIIAKQFSGMYRPDYVLPFKLDKDAAKEALNKFLKWKILVPKEFKSQNHIDKISGLYVPYWLFNCVSDAHIRFNATKISSWREGDYKCTKTKHYLLTREGSIDFQRIPVDGTSKVNNDYSEAVEPFDYSAMVDFQTAYLSGYLADKYDITSDECVPRVNERIRESVISAFSETVNGYSTYTPDATNINIKQGDIRNALLPIWMLNTKYKDKIYNFAMNGQTGKFVGKLPLDWMKFWLWFLGIFVGLASISTLIAMLILFGGNR